MKMTAKVVPYSSVVGSSVILQNESGRVVAQLAVLLVPTKEDQIAVAEMVANAINARQHALSNAPGQEAVPVAWRWTCIGDSQPFLRLSGVPLSVAGDVIGVQPLYAHPAGEKEGRA